ncbi:MAG TPA: chemotaxis protein CheW [Usitatibacter sp.]|nr:chemotaxis protein CheW [Usitatibacter sp.]
MSLETTFIADLTAPAAEASRREFLTCRLGEETYGIDILKVQEIREIDCVSRVPRVARHVRGVINLRGEIVPIVDLGLMFGFPKPLELKDASAIVLNVDDRLVGLAVSGVSDVIGLAEDEILPPPELGDRAIAHAISGIGTRDGASLLLLDVDRLMKRVREERE